MKVWTTYTTDIKILKDVDFPRTACTTALLKLGFKKAIGPLQLSIHVVENRHVGTEKSHWDKTKGNYHLKITILFFFYFYYYYYYFFFMCPQLVAKTKYIDTLIKLLLTYLLKIMYAFCWSYTIVTFASQHGGVVPRELKATKGLLLLEVKSACQQATMKLLSPCIMSFSTSRHNWTDTMTYSNIVMGGEEIKFFGGAVFVASIYQI